MTSRLTLYTTLAAETVQIEDHWCATQDALGLYAYGTSAEHASSCLLEAVNLMIDMLMEHGGQPAVEKHLKNAGISFDIGTSEDAGRAFPVRLALSKPLDTA